MQSKVNLVALSLSEFLRELAGKSSTPGGGSASALAGAMAAALLSMFCRLTIGKKKYKNVEQEMLAKANAASTIMERLTEAIQDDSAAFYTVMAVRNDPAAYQDALKTATLIPLEVAEFSLRVFTLATEAIWQGNQNARSDIQTSIFLARAAVLGALANVTINLSEIEDGEFRNEVGNKTATILCSLDRD